MRTESDSSFLKKYWVDFTFLGLIILIFFILGFYEHLTEGPGGIHYIRQTDSLAFIDHYYDNGYNFFKPGTLNIDSTDGNAACEFPIIYYFISLLYGVFGKHYFFLRFVNLLISVYGLYHLLKLSQKLVKDNVYAILISLFFFTSTIYNYYIFNFLPDAAALGLSMIGWNLSYNQFKSPKPKWHIPFLIFTLTGLIKVTYLISPIAIVGFLLFNHLKKKNLISIKPVLIWFVVMVLTITAWNLYVIIFNNYYDTEYFTTGARPIWGMPDSEVSKTWDHIFNFWFYDYLAHSSHHLLWGLIILQIIFIKKSKRYVLLTGLLSIGALCYFLLFFSQFKDHDYYGLTLIPIIGALLISGINLVKSLSIHKYVDIGIKLVLTTVIIIGINYSRTKITIRMDERINDISTMGLHLENNSLKVQDVLPDDSRTLILEDLTKNGGFLALNRKGWTLPAKEDFTQDTLHYFMENGLSHIISPKSINLKAINLENSYPIVYQDSMISVYQIVK